MRYSNECVYQVSKTAQHCPTLESALSVLHHCIKIKEQENMQSQKNKDNGFLAIAALIFTTIFFIWIHAAKNKKSTTTKPVIDNRDRKKYFFNTGIDTLKKEEQKNHPVKKRLLSCYSAKEIEPLFTADHHKRSPLRRRAQKELIIKNIASKALIVTTPENIPTQIFFNCNDTQYTYPPPPQATYSLHPLPSTGRSKPVARVTINNQIQTVYATQFGILRLQKKHKASQKDILIHQRCLENGQVVFDNKINLFKTHPVRTGGDQRVYATQQVKNEDGLTLHFFDQIAGHAHYKQ